MKRECCVPMCSKVYSHTFKKSQDKTTYFSFPTNEIYKRVWAKLVSRREKSGELWMPSSSSRICSLHFEESQFRHWASYRRLLPNALPTVFPGYPDKILRRQLKIIENFRKNNPLGEETLDKSTSSRKQNDSMNGEDSIQVDLEDSHQSGSEISKLKRDAGEEDDDCMERRLSTEDSEVPKHSSEESKPFKKRRIDSELQSNGNVLEEEFNTGGPKTIKSSFSENNTPSHSSKNQPVSSNEPIVKIQRLEQKDIDGMLGRGKRKKIRSVKLEYDSDASKVANDSPIDEDYIPTEEFSRKTPEKGNISRAKDPEWNRRLEEERYDSEESQVSKNPSGKGASSKAKGPQVSRRLEEGTYDFEESHTMKKMRVMQQQIKWKDERLFTLNQKAVTERNARLKAEKELEFLKVYMRSQSLDIPKPSESDLKSIDLDRDRSADAPNTAASLNTATSSRVLELTNTIKRLKEVIASKDKCLVELSKDKKPISVRNDYGALQGDWHPKNRFIQKVKKILEDSMDGDDQALFLLDQLESYGNDDVENFRMTTIKKCVEWRLLNSKGYESVRHMGILALPSPKLLRDHVDVLTEIGVTAREDVGVESDLGELEDEIEEEENNSINKSPSSTKKVLLKKATFLNSLQRPEDDEMLKVIGKTRQKFMKGLQPSSSSMKCEVENIRKSPQTKKIEQNRKAEALQCDSAMVGHQSGESKQPFRMELSSGILIEEVEPTDENSPSKSGNASVEKHDVSMESRDESIDNEKTVSSNTKDSVQNKKASPNIGNAEVLIDEDPTSENLVQDVDCADIDDVPEHASEDNTKRASQDGGDSTAEYTEEAATEIVVEPASDVVEPNSEDLVEDTVEQGSEGRLNSSDLKDDIQEEQLPPGCYIEEVHSSDDD